MNDVPTTNAINAPKVVRCGDFVLHKPTGETWVVANASVEHDEVMWMGWPEGSAKLSDCEVIEQFDDERYLGSLRAVAASSGIRAQRARYELQNLPASFLASQTNTP